mgnify:FL=1
MRHSTIDLGYRPRPQFEAFHNRSERFACIVAHRRAGKTVACIADLQDAALRSTKERPRFAYVAPYLRQAKATAWDYLRSSVSPLISVGARVNESELRVDYTNGGRVRLFGADNADALRGGYFDGVVCDEYADWDPRVWPEVIRPALSDRRGWAVFIGTPKGHNAFYHLWQQAKKDPEWFAIELRASQTGILDEDELFAARKDLTEDQYAQEYECSFEAAIVGSYYGKLINEADAAGHICGVPYDPIVPVWTAWDLGIRDATAIWFAQVVGREVHLIDYYEATGADLGHYVSEILSRNYVYGGHIVPHDAQARELGTGKSRIETLESLGLRNIIVAPDHRVEDGINAVRLLLPRCWFDGVKCNRAIEALKLYRADYNDKLQALKPAPVHDWTSHCADAMRYLSMSIDEHAIARPKVERTMRRHHVGAWMGA